MLEFEKLPKADLILLPGFIPNASIYSEQLLAFPHLKTPEWTPPQENESLKQYAERFAQHLNPQQPFIIGGFSFGGVVALEMALTSTFKKHCKGVVLISTCRSEKEIPVSFKNRAFFCRFLPDFLLSPLLNISVPLYSNEPHLSKAQRDAIKTALPFLNLSFLRWSIQALVSWKHPGEDLASYPKPLFQIHGSENSIFPPVPFHCDPLIENARHLIPLTHSNTLNQSLKKYAWETGYNI